MSRYTRTTIVDHGVDRAETFAHRPLNAPHGFKFFADDIQRGFTYDSRRGVWWPDDGCTYYSATEKYLVDHFCGHVINDGYDITKDSEATAAAHDTDAQGGIATMVTGTTDNKMAQISMATIWEAEEGAIRLGARLKGSNKAVIAFFFGLTDEVGAGQLEMPFELDTVTYTSHATDACGLLYDTDATSDTIRLVGVADDTDATHVDSSTAVVNDTYLELLLELTAAGVLTGYIDETVIGTTVASALSVGVDVTPIIAIEARDTSASRTLTLDWWFCHQDG